MKAKKFPKCSSCSISITPVNVVGKPEAPLCRNCYDAQELNEADLPIEERKKITVFEAPDQIDSHLWLGSCFSDVSLTYLRKKGIGAIVLVCSEGILRWPDEMEYYRIQVEDTLKGNLTPFFLEAIEFIRSHIEKNQGVLLRCAAGVSRSASVVAAYLMKVKQLTRDEAIEYIKRSRPMVSPNPAFLKQLKHFESELELSQPPHIYIPQPNRKYYIYKFDNKKSGNMADPKPEYKFDMGVLYMSAKPEDMSKPLIFNIHDALKAWKRTSLEEPPAEPTKGEPPKKVEIKAKDEFVPLGRERYRDKVAELEERVIAAGVVGDTSELDLGDSFIDDTEKSSVHYCFYPNPNKNRTRKVKKAALNFMWNTIYQDPPLSRQSLSSKRTKSGRPRKTGRNLHARYCELKIRRQSLSWKRLQKCCMKKAQI
eukprot:TRINITY_DN106356_c0_g1_i1.p1 TRINITY_DN106356_c0_g1~~TRINITY_DN106356_c0_g1_i1.p1  ORF type:complete len:425 (-),score=18.78 TRINITY_DN106356_c0_g1_i1:880-2154(-)